MSFNVLDYGVVPDDPTAISNSNAFRDCMLAAWNAGGASRTAFTGTASDRRIIIPPGIYYANDSEGDPSYFSFAIPWWARLIAQNVTLVDRGYTGSSTSKSTITTRLTSPRVYDWTGTGVSPHRCEIIGPLTIQFYGETQTYADSGGGYGYTDTNHEQANAIRIQCDDGAPNSVQDFYCRDIHVKHVPGGNAVYVKQCNMDFRNITAEKCHSGAISAVDKSFVTGRGLRSFNRWGGIDLEPNSSGSLTSYTNFNVADYESDQRLDVATGRGSTFKLRRFRLSVDQEVITTDGEKNGKTLHLINRESNMQFIDGYIGFNRAASEDHFRLQYEGGVTRFYKVDFRNPVSDVLRIFQSTDSANATNHTVDFDRCTWNGSRMSGDNLTLHSSLNSKGHVIRVGGVQVN